VLPCNFIEQVMLMNPEWSESQESSVVLQETPACAAIFGDFLSYFYTGQIRINHLRVMPILALADKYNVKVSEIHFVPEGHIIQSLLQLITLLLERNVFLRCLFIYF
jgi:hypothetical protein